MNVAAAYMVVSLMIAPRRDGALWSRMSGVWIVVARGSLDPAFDVVVSGESLILGGIALPPDTPCNWIIVTTTGESELPMNYRAL
jgi:hypothetical protein